MELFFKWIKQHLRIKAFYGTSDNAVKTQIWIVGLLIEITDATQLFGIIFLSVETAKHHGLIAAKAGGFVDSIGVKALEAKVFLGSGDKEGRILLDAVKASEVHVAAIHHVD